jgi:hypothetical protein
LIFVGEVYPASSIRNPGSASNRFRRAIHPPECLPTFGPVIPRIGVDVWFPWPFPNQRNMNLKTLSGATKRRVS